MDSLDFVDWDPMGKYITIKRTTISEDMENPANSNQKVEML